MKYERIRTGIFKRRVNRFIAEIEIDGVVEKCHVKNTGRCKELFLPDIEVILQESENPDRKTKYDLIAVKKEGQYINVDSQIPNTLAEEWVRNSGYFQQVQLLKREVTYGKSRFDLYLEYGDGKKAFMEVKGVTLADGDCARFPDAPTLRGVKHVEELCRCREEGYEAYLMFMVQMQGMTCVRPNWTTHPQFGEALLQARKQGVCLLACSCAVEADSIKAEQLLPVDLQREDQKAI